MQVGTSFHDIVPAHELGIRAIWINRLGEGDDPSIAAAVLPDLETLPETVLRLESEGEYQRPQHQERARQ